MKFFFFKPFKLIKDFERLLYHDIIKRNKTTPFWIFISMLLTFIFYRLYALVYPIIGFSIIVKNYHFHHFFVGIALISIACWTALITDKQKLKRISAILFGIGLGAITDEFGLLVTCGTESMACDYWHRLSYDSFVFVSMLFLIIIYFGPFWRKIGMKLANKVFLPLFRVKFRFK